MEAVDVLVEVPRLSSELDFLQGRHADRRGQTHAVVLSRGLTSSPVFRAVSFPLMGLRRNLRRDGEHVLGDWC